MQTNLIIPWRKSRLAGFRFFAVFFALYIIPFPLTLLPKADDLFGFYETAWNALTQWTGKWLFHLPSVSMAQTGSGDRTADFLQLFMVTVMAFLTALSWTLADRRPRNYDRLCYWMAVWVRYYVGTVMFSYGFAKVIKTQFPTPSVMQLSQSYGQSSPMRLAWTFMGYSKAYNVFTGLGEVIGGLLIFFRRTILTGALLLIVVMSNVVAINFCFDVPVKIYSSLYLLMLLWIAWPYRRRMYQFFIQNSDVLPHPFFRVVLKRWQHITLRIIKFLLIASAVYSNVSDNWGYYAEYGDDTPPQEFEGLYEVKSFVINADTLPPLTTDTIRWRKLFIGNNGTANIQYMNDSLKRFRLDKDADQQQWKFTARNDTAYHFVLHYQKLDSTHLTLTGPILKDRFYMQIQKLPVNDYLLLKRGFHWINEFPYNR